MESGIRSPTLHEGQEANRALERGEDRFVYEEDRPRTARRTPDLADQFGGLSINDGVESQLFASISKGNSLPKIDALTGAENFREWETTVTWVLDAKNVLQWIKQPPSLLISSRWIFWERIDWIICVWFLLNVTKEICQYITVKTYFYDIFINIKTVFEAFSQVQLVSLLKRFFTYQAQSEQSIDEVFMKLSLICTQIDEIDLTLVSDEWHQMIILQTAVD